MNRRVRLGCIGVGAWGSNVLRALLATPGCHVKVVCDQQPSALKVWEDQDHGVLRLTRDAQDVWSDPALDAVVIATDAASHASLVRAALRAGKHVFVEKPLALNIQDGESLVALARAKQRILMVGHLLLYHPAVARLKRYVDDGVLGELYYMYAARVNLGRVRHDENALWSLGPHDIAVMLFLIGALPTHVQAHGASYLQAGIEDVTFVTLEFPRRVLGHLHVGWLDPHKRRQLTVVGSKKMVVFDDVEAAEKLRLYDKGIDVPKTFHTFGEFLTLRSGDVHMPKLRLEEPLAAECRHFVQCLQRRSQPVTNGEHGVAVLRVLDAAERSLRQHGRRVLVKTQRSVRRQYAWV